MPPASSTTSAIECAQCGAQLRADAANCWLCHASADLHPARDVSSAAEHAQSDSPISERGFSLASLMMFVTLVSVVLGLSTIAPGIGIPLGLIVLVVWLRTAAVTKRRAARGLALTNTEQVQLFASSFGVTVALLGLVGVAGFSAFWAACFACIGTYAGTSDFLGEDFAVTMGWIVCITVSLAIAFIAIRYLLPAIVRLVRRRWRRDVGNTEEKQPDKEIP